MKSNQVKHIEPQSRDLYSKILPEQCLTEADLERIYWDSEEQIKAGKFTVMDDAFFDNWKQELKTEFGSR